jgi:hypothetical protein
MAKTFRSKRSARRSRKVGGAACDLAAAFMRVTPRDDDYERMIDQESSSIDASLSYQEFYRYQQETVSSLSAEDCLRVKGLLELIKAKRINNMDMESCASMESSMLFFDKNKELVIANDR